MIKNINSEDSKIDLPSAGETLMSDLIGCVAGEQLKAYQVTVQFSGKRIVQGTELSGVKIAQVTSTIIDPSVLELSQKPGEQNEKKRRGYAYRKGNGSQVSRTIRHGGDGAINRRGSNRVINCSVESVGSGQEFGVGIEEDDES